MRILQVSSADTGGGAEGSAWNLFQSYRRRGHDSWLAVGKRHSDDPDVFLIPNDRARSLYARLWVGAAKPLERLRGKIRGAGRIQSALRWAGQPLRWARRMLGYEDFDYPGTGELLSLVPNPPEIVHCHNLHGEYFDLRRLRRLSRQAPVILNLRDTWLLSGHCAYFLDCDRWKSGCGRCPYPDSYPAVRHDRTAANWRKKKEIYEDSRLFITAPSRWLIDQARQSMLRGEHCRVIPNGIDLSVFRPGDSRAARKALGLPVKAAIVLMIAHSQYKDYQTMEAALARLPRPEKRELLFVCLGKSGDEQPLGNGRLRLCGTERDRLRLARYYQAADVYIHAAKAEAFGKTITEAMACAAPVVATDVGGISEQVEDGINGLLVPGRDSEDLARAVERLLDDEALSHAMGQRGAAAARARFSLERQADSFLEWYREILSAVSQGHPEKTSAHLA